MALATTSRALIGDTSNVTAYTSASFTPASNVLLVAVFAGVRSATADVDLPVITNSGTALTWVQVGDFRYLATGANRARVSVFAASTGGAPGSIAITATFANALVGCCAQIFEIAGSDVSHGVGQCFVQAVNSTAGATGTALAITLAAAANANNRSLVVKAHFNNEAATFTAPWVSIPGASTSQHSTPGHALHAGFNATAFDTNAACAWTTSTNYGGIAFEIKALPVVSYTVAVTPASFSFPAFSSVGVRASRLATVTAPASPLLTFSPVNLLRTYVATIPTINFAYTVNDVAMVKQKAPAIVDTFNIPLTFNAVGLTYLANPPEPPPPKALRPAPGRLKPGDKVYVSVQGDMWDLISQKVYGMQRGSDRYMDRLIEANAEFMDYSSMPGGLYIFVPPLPVQTEIPLVPWKRTTVLIKT